MDQDRRKDWRELCTEAATELDPAKLMHLISELTKALDERDRKRWKAMAENPNDEDLDTRSFRSEPAIG